MFGRSVGNLSPKRRDSKTEKASKALEVLSPRAWFISVAILLYALISISVDHQHRVANLRGHLHVKHAATATTQKRLRGALEKETAAARAAQQETAAASAKAQEKTDTLKLARDTLKAERDNARAERDAAHKDALAVKARYDFDVKAAQTEAAAAKAKALRDRVAAAEEHKTLKSALDKASRDAHDAVAATAAQEAAERDVRPPCPFDVTHSAIRLNAGVGAPRTRGRGRGLGDRRPGRGDRRPGGPRGGHAQGRGAGKRACRAPVGPLRGPQPGRNAGGGTHRNSRVEHSGHLRAQGSAPGVRAAFARRGGVEGVGKSTPSPRVLTVDPRAEVADKAAQTPAYLSAFEAIFARMTHCTPTDADRAEAAHLEEVMEGSA